ncbi:hypothetical protein QWY31_07650 [Cytophagales bacterium LB-30]|uniref:DUF3313 domain-containing protein n=1 Tax=Shiella aurantiaca TaxID=3058365 RepID=A0ABT8F570_9BACT|nr:hypothetical protein [Shiella aurantiaca]MDN4165371.1 hypothetical protein [Shiella aurantiaca]
MKRKPIYLALLIALGVLIYLPASAQLGKKQIMAKGFKTKEFAKAPKRVFIHDFSVYHHVFESATATVSGASAKLSIALEDLTPEVLMEISEESYQYLVKQLTDKGYEIVTAEEAQKAPFFSDWTMKSGGQLNTGNMPGYVNAVPPSMKYFVPGETKSGREKETFVDKSHIISQDLGDALVLQASYIFKAFDMDSKGGVYRNTAKVEVKTNPRMTTVLVQDGMKQIIKQPTMSLTYGKNLSAGKAGFSANMTKEYELNPAIFDGESVKPSEVSGESTFTGLFYSRSDKVKALKVHCDVELYKQETKKALREYIDYFMLESGL